VRVGHKTCWHVSVSSISLSRYFQCLQKLVQMIGAVVAARRIDYGLAVN
jgi:hypothetical protein